LPDNVLVVMRWPVAEAFDVRTGARLYSPGTNLPPSSRHPAVAPDGTRIACVLREKKLIEDSEEQGRVYRDYHEVLTYLLGIDGVWRPEGRHRHAGWLAGFTYSPDATLIASSCTYDTVCVWDAATGAQRATLPAARPWALAFSPDRARLVTLRDGRGSIWDIKTGQCLHTLIDDREAGIPASSYRDMTAFSPDGRLVVTVAGGTRVWDAATGEQRASFDG
jgi:WD40 repeat protein